MQRAMLMGLLSIGLVLLSTMPATACGISLGCCFVPYTSCGPCYAPCCYAPCYCYCVPVCCQPVCCQPACCQPAVSGPKAVPSKAAKQPRPTLAPPESTKPAEKKPAPKAPSKIILPNELSLPTPSNEPPKAAEGDRIPVKAPARPKDHPIERPATTPAEKPLVANAEFDNPFILETDKLQIWTDSTGNYRIEARFVSFDEKTVRLQRPSGQYIRVAFDRLSIADRARVRDLSLVLAMRTSMK